MQTVTGYQQHRPLALQQFRLYHHDRPAVRPWRKGKYQLDIYDFTISQMSESVVAVDFAGWYLPVKQVMCIESSPISKLYCPDCHIEPDLETYRPDYVPNSSLVIFKRPWFLKYATMHRFVNFLNVWVRSPTLIVFEPRLIQHNHLKYSLKDLVQQQTNFTIDVPLLGMWKVTP